MRSTTHQQVRHSRRHVSGLGRAWALGALSSALLAGCQPADDRGPDAPTDGQVAVLESPAAPGAAEPNLSSSEDGVVLSWLEPAEGEAWSLRLATWTPEGWGPTRTVVTRDDLFVNWADFPSTVTLADGRLAAHWLQRGGAGGYDYGVRVALSSDDGATWSEGWTPHEDGTPTEHGFVSMWPTDDGGLGLIWLDGRHYADSEARAATDEMTLRYRALAPDGSAGPEVEVDDRICDCCQTSVARAADGWIAVYRDRTGDEVRDIYSARLVDGVWQTGRPVHRDGWTIEACPVNGPSVSARGNRVAVAWFTAAAETPRVEVAFSDDGGGFFTEPTRVDDGDPVGRVDVLVDADGDALVTWVERTDEGAEVRMRRVSSSGAGPTLTLATTTAARAAGFPRVVALPGGDVLAAWTDVTGDASRVRVARVTPPAP